MRRRSIRHSPGIAILITDGPCPALHPKIAPYVDAITRNIGRPSSDSYTFRFFIARELDALIVNVIELCRVADRARDAEVWHDLLELLARGPAEAAEALLAEHRGRLPFLQTEALRSFLAREALALPHDTSDLTPEQAAAAHARALSRIVQAARTELAKKGRSPRGPKADFALDWFIMMVVRTAREGKLTGAKPTIEFLTSFVREALVAASRYAHAEIERRADLRELPSTIREKARRRIVGYARLGHEAIRKRVLKVAGENRKSARRQEKSGDVIRA
jgi:hypothetical protein